MNEFYKLYSLRNRLRKSKKYNKLTNDVSTQTDEPLEAIIEEELPNMSDWFWNDESDYSDY